MSLYQLCMCLWGVTLTLLCVEVNSQHGNVCQTLQYRALSPELQNEHRCMILEKLQQNFEEDKMTRERQFSELKSLVMTLQLKLNRKREHASDEALKWPARNSPALRDVPLVKDCYDLIRNRITKSGVYPLRIKQKELLNVYCDMETENGGWTIIQRRANGELNFTRKWDDYTFGFGNVNSEYWLGNENIYQLTEYQNYSLRIELWDWEDNTAYAQYDFFKLDSESEGYRLHVQGFNGTAGDSLGGYHNNMKFSTYDKDNDMWFSNCAQKDQSGWWFKGCGFSSLNGVYVQNGTIYAAPDGLIKGIIWYHWKSEFSYSMKRTEMKIKPRVALILERELLAWAQQNRNNMENITQTPQEMDLS